jgi:hypothetical protein
MALLRWWRFLRAVGVGWDQATRAEARDFWSWIQLAGKPARPHWRYPAGGAPGTVTARAVTGTPNPVTGKPSAGRGYATATAVHCESVLLGFYEFHLQAEPRLTLDRSSRDVVTRWSSVSGHVEDADELPDHYVYLFGGEDLNIVPGCDHLPEQCVGSHVAETGNVGQGVGAAENRDGHWESRVTLVCIVV